MQEEQYRDFDLKLRETLLDAEVKPSKSVWKGISARLEEKPAATPVWWKWAGAALAAAAVCAVVLLPTKSVQEENLAAEMLVAQNIVEDTPEIELLAENSEPSVNKTPGGRRVIVLPSEQKVLPVEESVPAEEEVESVQQEEEEEVMVVQEEKEPVQDPFALLEEDEEDTRRASRPGISLTAGGDLSGYGGSTSGGPASHLASGVGSGLNPGISENSLSTYGIPVSFGVGVRCRLDRHWSVGTGVNYSLLTRSFVGTYTEEVGVPAKITNGNVLHKMQYVGIPLNVYYNLVRTSNLHVYAFGGGQAEFCLKNHYDIKGSNGTESFSDPVNGVQFSTAAGIGLEFRISRRLGLYLDPGARYYFDCGQPNSIRTAKPFMFNIDAGLRFNL